MWEPSDYIALAATFVAGLALAYTWWDRRGARAESYRAALYQQQLVATLEYLEIAREIHTGVLTSSDVPDGPWLGGLERLEESTAKALYLPPEVLDAAFDWLDDVAAALEADIKLTEAEMMAIKARIKGEEIPTPPPTTDLEDDVEAAWKTLVTRVRTEIGARSMHGTVRELTGAAGQMRKMQDRVARLRRLDIEVSSMRRDVEGRTDVDSPAVRKDLTD
jgi:hypothetical protein